MILPTRERGAARAHGCCINAGNTLLTDPYVNELLDKRQRLQFCGTYRKRAIILVNLPANLPPTADAYRSPAYKRAWFMPSGTDWKAIGINSVFR